MPAKKSIIDDQHLVSNNIAVVSICRDKAAKNVRHVFFIIERIKNDKRLISGGHLVIDKSVKKNLSALEGYAQIQYKDNLYSEKTLYEKSVNFISKSFSMKTAQAEILISNIQKDKDKMSLTGNATNSTTSTITTNTTTTNSKQVPYGVLGNIGLYKVSHGSQEAESCVSWAVNQLINLKDDDEFVLSEQQRKDLQDKSIIGFFASDPTKILPEKPKEEKVKKDDDNNNKKDDKDNKDGNNAKEGLSGDSGHCRLM